MTESLARTDPNLLFFGNSVDASLRIEDLQKFKDYLESYLDGEAQYASELHSDLEIDVVPMFAETFPSILHASLLTSVIALAEAELRGYCGALGEALDLPLRLSDLSGNLLERAWAYMTKVARLDLKAEDLRWPDLIALFETRNCVVHAGASLEGFQKAQIIRDLSRRRGTPECDDNSLRVNAATSELALEVVSSLLDELFNAALRRFPGHYQPRARRA